MSWPAFDVLRPDGDSPCVIICDHASNAVPPGLANLGLPQSELDRHIGYDIGAAAITRLLSQRLGAPAVLCGTSRLVIDCNRTFTDPTLIPEASDGTPIPGNRAIGTALRLDRIARYFEPYHRQADRMLARATAGGKRPLVVSVHSMTDRMKGIHRPWQIALSSDANRRATGPVLAALSRVPGLTVGDNEPYAMDPAQDYSIVRHALIHGLDYLQVEFRQDEVATPAGQAAYERIFATAMIESGVLAEGDLGRERA